MPFLDLHVGKLYSFDYTNYKGLKESRRVRFESLSVGENEYHPELQWFLNGQCMVRNARRSFALKDIELQTIRELNTPKTWPEAWESFDQYKNRDK